MSSKQATAGQLASASSTEAGKLRRTVRRAIEKNTFLVLGTSSAQNRPLVAGLIYAAVDGALYVSTLDSSAKVRNVRANPEVAVTIPVRRLPFGAPPSTIAFQATAEVLPINDPQLVSLLGTGRLKKLTSHGELDLPGSCFIKITPRRRVNAYGLGMSLISLARDPLNAGRQVEL